MPEKFEAHIVSNQADSKIVDLLADGTELSRQAIKQVMQKGAVWVTRTNLAGKAHTQRCRRADKTINLGDQVHLYFDPAVLAQNPPSAQLIADEGDYSLWYKPSGMFSQGSKWGDHCTIGRWIETHLEPERPAFLIHRLDRAASGLILFAHSKKVAAALSRQFEERSVTKKYLAIVDNKLVMHIELNDEVDGRKAQSVVRPLEYCEKRQQSLVEVEISTGRKHQIRKHLSKAGYPIVGDRLYNAGPEFSDETPLSDLQLCAHYLSFDCPSTQARRVYELPAALRPSLKTQD